MRVPEHQPQIRISNPKPLKDRGLPSPSCAVWDPQQSPGFSISNKDCLGAWVVKINSMYNDFGYSVVNKLHKIRFSFIFTLFLFTLLV